MKEIQYSCWPFSGRFFKYVLSLFNKRIRSAQFLSHFVSVNEASCLDELKNNVSLNI